MEVITPMLYCSKCHALYENGTTCSNCNEPLTEPKPGNLVLLTAAMYAESNEILDAFRARGIYIDRKPTIEEGVFEHLKKHAPYQGEENTDANEQKPKLSKGKKWVLRIVAAVAFGLVIWGVVALTDFAMGFVKGWFS